LRLGRSRFFVGRAIGRKTDSTLPDRALAEKRELPVASGGKSILPRVVFHALTTLL
jgi:hypothetical protein